VNGAALGRALRSQVVIVSLTGVLAALAVLVVTELSGWSARTEYVVVVALVGALTLLALAQLGESLDTTTWPRRRPEFASSTSTDLTEDRVIFLETRLVLSTQDARVFKTRVQPLLAEIVRHELRRHHGIDAQQSPGLARQIAGEPLWRLVTEVRDEPITREELVDAIDRIERLSTSG